MEEQNFGFIREPMQVKLLILFVLRRLPAAIGEDALAELVLIDGGINYFDYRQCLMELIDTRQIAVTEEGYTVTPNGDRNAAALEEDIPFSVRQKAALALAPTVAEMRRMEMLTAAHSSGENGVTVHLAISDGVGSIFDLHILAADEKQAGIIERNFKKNAESFYHRFIEELSADKGAVKS